MSDTTSGTSEPQDAASGAPPQGDPADKPLGENGEKALKAERERASAAEKVNAALQKQLDEIAAANLSDLERAQKEAADFKAAAEMATAEALRFRVAAQHSISQEDADLFLTGTDEETLQRQAARLVERTPTSPRPDLSQGSKGDPTSTTTADQFARAIEGSFTR